jgi:2-dehydro-3-deoxygluconokinase
MRVACIGECMVELREEPDGRMMRGFGGDTLNTAIYLARLGIGVDYVTALGTDPWSEEMIGCWRGEGIGTDLVLRCDGQMPGLYVIQNDSRGERRFLYWRDSAAARRLFTLPETGRIATALQGHGLIYYSGISLSLYGEEGRARLAETLRAARARGAIIAFDTNFRPQGWTDRLAAQAAFRAAMSEADMIFASIEDLELLAGPDWEAVLSCAGGAEIIVKLREPCCRVLRAGRDPVVVNAPRVLDAVDTTAAGDSFAAAYIAARLRGLDPAGAATEGHLLAGAVIAHAGAVIPRAAMPALPSAQAETAR